MVHARIGGKRLRKYVYSESPFKNISSFVASVDLYQTAHDNAA